MANFQYATRAASAISTSSAVRRHPVSHDGYARPAVVANVAVEVVTDLPRRPDPGSGGSAPTASGSAPAPARPASPRGGGRCLGTTGTDRGAPGADQLLGPR